MPAAAAAQWIQAVYETPFLFAGILDDDGVLIDGNHLAIEGCGMLREQVLGHPLWEGGWWDPQEILREDVRNRCGRALSSGEQNRGISSYFLADGSERMVDMVLTPFLDGAGRTYVAVTGTDITAVHDEAAARREVEQLKTALTSRATIDQAIGIIMAQHRCDPDEAFGLLVKGSSDRNIKLRRLAREIVHKEW